MHKFITPRVGSDFDFLKAEFLQHISIHAPRVGSDRSSVLFFEMASKFQSTLPVWGATTDADLAAMDGVFQSTLPVWGATPRHMPCPVPILDFNPRSPCGERPRPGE